MRYVDLALDCRQLDKPVQTVDLDARLVHRQPGGLDDVRNLHHSRLLVPATGPVPIDGNASEQSARHAPRTKPGHDYARMTNETPTTDALVADLKTLREKGLSRLDALELPALQAAGRIIAADTTQAPSVAIETAVRRAVARAGGGAYGESAALLFGLEQGTRTSSPRLRRERAAAKVGRSADTFRKRYEPTMLLTITNQLLTLCSEQNARDARDHREPREPVESAMVVEWLRRFESYYRMWTPIYGLGNDLTAYRLHLIDSERLWDRRFGTLGPEDTGYSQEEQAEGYARFALYHYARFEWELHQFVVTSGGLWLLSEPEAEHALADSVYEIGWNIELDEREQSYLRTVVAESPEHELYGFLERIAEEETGRRVEQVWQDWASTCGCSWGPKARSDNEYFPTSDHHDGIKADCKVHRVIHACGVYMDLVDQDWNRIADWYRIKEEPVRGLKPDTRYMELPREQRVSEAFKRGRE